jgi:hypothetical protein
MEINESTLSSSQSSSGCWCIFVPLSDTQGVKFYHAPEVRDAAAKLQSEAHAVGVGPEVGYFCEMPYLASWDMPSGWHGEAPDTVYGYITELVDDSGLETKDFQKLLDRCREHGISVGDLGSYLNTGYSLKTGEPLKYDFDPFHNRLSKD